MLTIFNIVTINEWEVADDYAIKGVAIPWGIVVTAFKGNITFYETIVVVEFTVLFDTHARTNEADIVIIH